MRKFEIIISIKKNEIYKTTYESNCKVTATNGALTKCNEYYPDLIEANDFVINVNEAKEN